MTPGDSLYNIVLFLHIMGVIVWLGGGITLKILNGRVAKRGPEAMAAFGEDMEFIGAKVLGSGSGLALLSGLVMVIFSGGAWTFEEPWVAIGMVGWIVSAGIGMGMIAPAGKKLGAAMKEKGPDSAEALALKGRIKMLSTLNIVVITVVVFDMVIKPFQ